MSAITNFNIFKFLEKDDKELIHSSFLKFLFIEYKEFSRTFLQLPLTKFLEPELEKPYALPLLKSQKNKNKQFRIDFEAHSGDKRMLLVIENKFKSFPNSHQLCFYDELYKYHYPQKEIIKFLFCFDKHLISFPTDWHIKDYSDLLSFINDYCFNQTDHAKHLFILHYYDFLSQYYKQYQTILNNSRDIFINPRIKENKFWLRLLYSAIALKLNEYFNNGNIEVKIEPDSGNTSVPLLNIIPKNWTIDGVDLLIQFQGADLKFYSHKFNRDLVTRLAKTCTENIASINIKPKTIGNREVKTCYIFKTSLLNLLPASATFTIEQITNTVIALYNIIEHNVIKKL